MLQPLLAPSLAGVHGVAHGFFTRQGGVSTGLYTSLNCGLGSQDDAADVRENRARVAAHLGVQHLMSAYQVHGTDVVTVTAAPQPGAVQRPRADALATRVRGVALGVLTADCAPVLLAEPNAGVVAAVHAGWRGALAGVVEAAVAAMVALGADPSRIRAGVGPCIGQAAYEVGPEFEAAFVAADAANGRFFRRAGQQRPRFDLGGYVGHRLELAGVPAASRFDGCTFAGGEQFFSYRRSRTANQADYGRQISAIVLT